MSIASGKANPVFLPQSDELPTGGIVREIALCPGQDEAGTNAIENTLGNNHQRHLVFAREAASSFFRVGL